MPLMAGLILVNNKKAYFLKKFSRSVLNILDDNFATIVVRCISIQIFHFRTRISLQLVKNSLY